MTCTLRHLSALFLSVTLLGASASAGQDTGYLRDGASTYSQWMYLEEGDLITVTGECDWDCLDLDLYLINSTGDVVDRDTEDDDFPVMVYRIRSDSWYRVRTYMADCDGLCEYTTTIRY